MAIKLRSFYKWIIVWCLFLALVLYFMSGIDLQLDSASLTIASKKSFFEILQNNSYNYALYFLLFPINILMVAHEFLMLGVNMYMGYQVYGLEEAASLLLPHAVLELPNILFYSFLSFHLCCKFWNKPKISTIIQTISANWKYYLISYGVLIVAAWIEGSIR